MQHAVPPPSGSPLDLPIADDVVMGLAYVIQTCCIMVPTVSAGGGPGAEPTVNSHAA